MAESQTARMALKKYSAGTDSFSRDDWNLSIDNLEARAARDDQGTFAARPIPAVRGFYYWDTTNEMVWRDTGSAWKIVGARVFDSLIKSSVVGAVPLTVQGITGQTANIFDVKNDSGTSYLAVEDDGLITSRGSRVIIRGVVNNNEHAMVITANATGEKPLSLVIPDASTKSYIEMKKLTGAVIFEVKHDGKVVALSTLFDSADITHLTKSETLQVTDLGPGATLGTTNVGIMIGTSGATDNLHITHRRMQSRFNGAAAELDVNDLGGLVVLGHADFVTRLKGQVQIYTSFSIRDPDSQDPYRFSIQPGAPTSPVNGDVWIPNA